MRKVRVFVDGQAGTTGLQILQRLQGHPHVTLLEIKEELRKDPQARREMMRDADVLFLCLPDDAARESVALAEQVNPEIRILDASTAHRTAPGWVYGLPEMRAGQRQAIAAAQRVAVPGCHATGFVLAVYPLVATGLIPATEPVICHAVTGYSGGGKKLIEKYTAPRPANVQADHPLQCPRHYALGLSHKHLPEMTRWAGLTVPPLFHPIIGDYAQGLAMVVPFHAALAALQPVIQPIEERAVGRPGERTNGRITPERVHACLSDHYRGERFVHVMPMEEEGKCQGEDYFNPMACNGTNRAEIFVFGYDRQTAIITRLDNLGKGASGAAVQNMNLMLGFDEGMGLDVAPRAYE